MIDFLIKLKLLEQFKIELKIQKSEFIDYFINNVDVGSTGFFSDAFDNLSFSKNEYKGYIEDDHFKIKRRRKFFDINLNIAVAKGTYRQDSDNLIVDTEIRGFNGMIILYYIFFTLFYLAFFIGLFTEDFTTNHNQFFYGLGILLHALFMFGLPYFLMRRSVQRLKHELEREFYYITKK